MIRVEFRASKLLQFPGRLRSIPQVLRANTADAINKAGDRVVDELAANLGMQMNMSPETVRKQIRIRRASYQRLEFEIDASSIAADEDLTSTGRRLPKRRFGTPQQPERFFRQGQLVRVVTMEDDSVCEKCRAVAEGRYSIEEARTLVPVHPNCRCHVEMINQEQDQPTFTTPSGRRPQRGGGKVAQVSFEQLARDIAEGARKAVLTVKNV